MYSRIQGISIVLLAVTLLAMPEEGDAGLRAPLAGRGAFEFVADMPVFPSDGERSRVDLAVRVDHRQVRFRPAYGNPFQAEIELRVKIAREGRVVVDSTQVYEFTVSNLEEATDPQKFQLLEMALRVPSGNWAVTLTMLDRQASSEGLRRRAEAQASGVLHVPSVPAGRAMSDLEFRFGTDLPNPERLYGVVQDTLAGYFEIHGGAEDPSSSHAVVVEVSDPVYGGMDRQILRFESVEGTQARLYRLPLESFPEGNYVLRFLPTWLEESEGREYEFTVVWKMARFAARSGDFLLEAKLVLPDGELERFSKLAPAAQSAILQEFWDRHDPTPGTSRNETYEVFQDRVAYAWKFLGEALIPGPLTDRGRIYVRYGAPKAREIQVMPSNDDDLESAVTKVHDAYGIEFEGVIAREAAGQEAVGQGGNQLDRRAASERDLVAARDRRRLTSRVGSEGSFELWIYDFDGEPLLDDPAGWSENIGYRFLFVDRRGDGSYRLEYSNQPNRS